MIGYHYLIILLFLPNVSPYDCREVCDVIVYAQENTPQEDLQWNLIDLLENRTATRFPFEHYQYSLPHSSDFFQIHSPILKFHLKELDRETICRKSSSNDEECSLQLQIFTQTSFIILFKLIIEDVNDWKPSFKIDQVHVNIRENLPNNHHVQLPVAFDHDSSKFNIDHYEFLNQNYQIGQIFQLEQVHDELRLKLLKRLDCEERNNYQLEIIAVDKGGFKSNVLRVNVTVDDVNEYQPRFKQRSYHTRIAENVSITNASILSVVATDEDCTDKILLYSIITDLPIDLFPFDIDRYTGSIYVKQPLDYEKVSSYRFSVKASNLDQIASSFVPVRIDILDVNDNQPMIQMNILNEYKAPSTEEENGDFVLNINENVRSGQVLGTILIRDTDSAMVNRKLTLKILSCWPPKHRCPIEIDSGLSNSEDHEHGLAGSTNYLLRTSRTIDTEMGDEKYTIVLEARDYGDPSLSSQRRVLIVIHDQNDCVPKFSQNHYQFRLSERTPIGFMIGQIQATDHDTSSEFRRLQYQLIDKENNQILELDPNNGSLYLMKKLSAGMTFNLTALAIDQHNQSLHDQTLIEIILFDDANCLPTFTQTLYVFNTSEHHPTPFNIGQVYADSCLSSSIPISYHLVKDKTSATLPFTIDAHNGIITVTRELDREVQSFYKFLVDSLNHKTQQTSQTEVHINVFDENDHYPSFDNTRNHERELYIFINKSASMARRHDRDPTKANALLIARIHATDDDEGANGLVNYYFTNNDNYAYFHLFSNGSVVLYNSIDLQLPYRLEIYARDQGSPKPLNSRESIVIYVCDALKRDECPSDGATHQQSWLFGYDSHTNPMKISQMTTSFYLGSIFIMIAVLLFIGIIIICIVWNLIIKRQYRGKSNPMHNDAVKLSSDSYNCRVEARKNLIVSDSLYESSPTITPYDANHRLKSVAV